MRALFAVLLALLSSSVPARGLDHSLPAEGHLNLHRRLLATCPAGQYDKSGTCTKCAAGQYQVIPRASCEDGNRLDKRSPLLLTSCMPSNLGSIM